MKLKQATIKSLNNFVQMIPLIISILALATLINNTAQKFYNIFFTGNYLKDSLAGAITGSLSFGTPLTSYIIGGEFLKSGVSLLATTAFIMTWTTVGVLMLPLEMKMLGSKFAIWRNIINFIFAIIISILTISLIDILK